MRKQPFASPEEALAHYGVKGMRWGVRDAEEPVGTSTMKKDETKSGLTSTQKKMIIGAGVGVVAIGGFVAYKHYAGGSAPTPKVGDLTDWGNPFPKHPDMSGLKTGRLSSKPLGAMGKRGQYVLFRGEELTLDTSRGYADFRPVGGFANAAVAERHASTIRALEAMREQYPAVRNMNIEVAPMSHGYSHSNMPTALGQALQLGNGEARLYYNDVKGATAITPEIRSFISGADDLDSLGNHEMGHILAGAHGDILNADVLNVLREKGKATFTDHHVPDDAAQAAARFHKDLFRKHGMSFEELSSLSGYAATSPVEALAELSAHYHSPRLRAKMDPELRRKAKAMFDEMGGLL